MVTSVTFQLPAAGSTLAVDTKHTELPIIVQTALGADVIRGAPYLRDGRVFVDFTSSARSPRALTVLFARRWETP